MNGVKGWDELGCGCGFKGNFGVGMQVKGTEVKVWLVVPWLEHVVDVGQGSLE